jgi:DNA-damage-inducible protein D
MESIILENKWLSFEDFKNENGIIYWWASDLMTMLWYPNMKSFQKVLDRATKALVSLWIPHYENIIAKNHLIDWLDSQDFKLTRFACYITVMNGDPKKTEVAKAQAYFIQSTRKFELAYWNTDDIDRLLIRDEITEWNKSLSSIVKKAKIENYANFQNAWYLWMYNMTVWKLEKSRNIKKWKLMDNIWRAELAANLFRITQTEERIKNKWIEWQQNLEQTHYQVWKEVRRMVIDNSWKPPEKLPQEKELPAVKKDLKDWYKKMLKEDTK